MHGVAAMTLLSSRSFPRHAHDQFGLGVLLDGAQRSWSCVGQVESQPGDAIMVNPGEMHDGMPIGGARAWRMLHLAPELVARELDGADTELVHPSVRDPILAALFVRLFARITQLPADLLAVEEALARTLAHVARNHVTHPRVVPPSGPVAKARQRLDDAPAEATSLQELATLTGLSRFQLVRSFAREVGVTPHAYLIQRRVSRVRQLLAAGATLADAALQAGFADQSHMNRAFVRQFGVTPGRYRAALA